jgi:hypothetical protein
MVVVAVHQLGGVADASSMISRRTGSSLASEVGAGSDSAASTDHPEPRRMIWP